MTDPELINRILSNLDSMDERLTKQLEDLKEGLVKLDDRLDRVSEIQVKQQSSLDEHMRRTALLEEALVPIKEHISTTIAIAKIVAGLGAVLGLLLTIKELIH